MNKYLHTVGSVGFLFTLNYDAQNHKLKTQLHNCDLRSGPLGLYLLSLMFVESGYKIIHTL